MPVSQIIGVVLRLVAIRWLFEGFSLGMTDAGVAMSRPSYSLALSAVIFLMPVCLIAMAFLLWWFAAWLGRIVVGASDPVLLTGSITREDLFAIGILVMGLWVALTNVGNAFSWMHYLVLAKDGQRLAQGGNTLYQAIQTIVPCVAGLLLALNAVSLGRRLARVGPARPVDTPISDD